MLALLGTYLGKEALFAVLTSKTGRAILGAVGGVLLLFAVFGAGSWHGGSKANARWEAKALENKIRTLEADLAIQRTIAADAALAATAIAAADAVSQQNVQEYTTHVQSLEQAVRDARITSDDDVRRLCDIGGANDRGPDCPANTRGLRKARGAR